MEKLVELLVVADSEQNVSGDDPGFFVVLGSISSELKHLSSKVLNDAAIRLDQTIKWSVNVSSL